MTTKPDYLSPTNLESPSAREFWRALPERRFLARRCPRCRVTFFPPRPLCPECLAGELEWTELSGRGTLHSWTRIQSTCAQFDAPYDLGLVDLEGGVGRVLGRIVNAEGDRQPRIGMPVRMTFVEMSTGFTLYAVELEPPP